MTHGKRKVSIEMRTYFKLNENENTRLQDMQDTGKAVFRGKFIVLNANIRR